ncbi:MAG: formyl transferase [Pelagibacteraceae bacterium TMED124]|nr:formyl transferase [Candidatus Neomarinimicrobiota bacterium]RPG16563.1 MAG: formyl transferase [Pelagibacteraceae bacterium TMED124]|tara:strand:+ start:534 stop:1493 length:960 start_codon:yes stop_codon:yes gene_type:complete
MKVALIGGVNSSFLCLRKLKQYDLDILKVYGNKPKNVANVSSYKDLKPFCDKEKIQFKYFEKINDFSEEIQNLNLDILFVVGVSQLVNINIINSAKIGSIGFHPTQLPKGRGRAPVAWLVNDVEDGAATFFVLEEGADTGGILYQENFNVNKEHTAQDVEESLLGAMEIALDNLLPKLIEGWWNPKMQNELDKSEYGVRKPNDGLVSWNESAYSIERLVKAAAHPHPGAFTFYGSSMLKINNAWVEKKINIKGVIGRVLKLNKNRCLVQAGDGIIWIEIDNFESYKIRVGSLLGYKKDLEIFRLKKELIQLKKLLKNKD